MGHGKSDVEADLVLPLLEGARGRRMPLADRRDRAQ